MNLNVDFDLFEHPKFKRLQRLVGPGAMYHLLLLWRLAGKWYWVDGEINQHSVAELEAELEWLGEEGLLVEHLVVCGWLDRTPDGILCVHDWLEYQGHIVALRMRSRNGNRARWNRLQSLRSPQVAPKDSLAASKESLGDAKESLIVSKESLDDPKESPRQGKTRQGNTTQGKATPATPVPEEPPEVQEAEYGNLEQHLLAEWGQDGRIGWAQLTRLLELGKTYGREALFNAITEAGRLNVRKVRYVERILEPKEAAAVTVDNAKKLKRYMEAKGPNNGT